MAKSRYVSTKFWGDNYIDTLQLDEKLLFLYAITNEGLDLCGIYEFNLKVACVLTGISVERILDILQKFENDHKMKFENGWLAIKNFQKYQNTRNQSIKEGIKRSLDVAPVDLKEWVDESIITQQNKNGEYERGTSGIPEVDERGTSRCTLLNSTLLNSTLPNLTQLNSKERGEDEEKKEEKAQGSVTTLPEHVGNISQEIVLPAEIEEIFTDFLAMRKAKKVPNTPRAIKSLRKKASEVLYQEGDKKLILELERSIMSGWRDFYYDFKKTGNRHVTEEEREERRKEQMKNFTFLALDEDEE